MSWRTLTIYLLRPNHHDAPVVGDIFDGIRGLADRRSLVVKAEFVVIFSGVPLLLNQGEDFPIRSIGIINPDQPQIVRIGAPEHQAAKVDGGCTNATHCVRQAWLGRG